jgi:uncharacterized repeat protein (TIGR03803 family)
MTIRTRMTCILAAFCVVTAIVLPAQTLTTLYSFSGFPYGAGLDSPLTLASDGNFYGTTSGGGTRNEGTLFQITPSGTLTTLYNFCAQPNCDDGVNPYGALVPATDGNFYGITQSGGSGADNAGTVFTITPSGSLTTLYSFCTQYNCSDGRYPDAVIQAADGNFYGATSSGGGTDCADGCGTIFKITASGTLTTLYRFCTQGNCPDGYNAWGLIQGSDGNFYGVTGHGGASGNRCDGLGCGTIFKITASGSLTTIYNFCTQSGCPDGQFPNGQLVLTHGGNFYGTTSEGGAYGGGTIFTITPSGSLTTLYSFCSQTGCPDGSYPTAPPVLAIDGNFYGSTYSGGAYLSGTLYKLTPEGRLTTLYSFCHDRGCPGGELPDAALVPYGNGKLYGVTGAGGSGGYGTIFRLAIARNCLVCRNVE